MSTRLSVSNISKIILTPTEFELKNSYNSVTKLSGVLIKIFDESESEVLIIDTFIHSSEKKIKVEFAETQFIKG
jgi:hypothetical protein